MSSGVVVAAVLPLPSDDERHAWNEPDFGAATPRGDGRPPIGEQRVRTNFLSRHGFHAVFFAALYACYLYAIFGMANVVDAGNVPHSLARLVAAAVELALFYLVGLYLLRRWLATRRTAWFVLYMLLAALVCLVYVAQMYSIYLSNNFISALAMQNLDSASYTQSAMEWVMLGGGTVGWLLLGAAAWRRAQRGGHADGWLVGRRLAAAFVVLVLLDAFLFTQQRRRVTLEPEYRQVPFASLVVNIGVALTQDTEHGAMGSAASLDGKTCLSDPAAGKIAGYPFQKDVVFSHPLPFAATKGAVAHPNVIVIFTEGTSARLIGAYGGRYARLTPNIDRFAARAMKVVDYYNHTAATYRGLIGQTSSGFSFAGGSGQDGWASEANTSRLAAIRRQTLATILGGRGYDTYFFEPEHDGTPFTHMLRSLGFDNVETFETTSTLLHGDVAVQDQTDQLDDGSLFRGLTAFLKAREHGPDGKPFFVATYNIGTHAFIPMVAGGHAYGDGHSQVLDKLHNYDAAVGAFLDYFDASPYAENTIVVFTSDHATYPDKPYRDVAGKGLKPFFVDRIPLLVYDPTHHLPRVFDAQGRNSLDMAPTLLQLLGIGRVPNSFLGASLFEMRRFPLGITALGDDFYVTTPAGVDAIWEVPPALKKASDCEKAVVDTYYQLEAANHLFKPRG